MSEYNFRGQHLDLYRDEDGWAVEVHALPGCVAGGDTIEETLRLAEDAIEAWLEAAADDGRAPRAAAQDDSLREAALRVHEMMREHGLTCTGTHSLDYAVCQSLARAALAGEEQG